MNDPADTGRPEGAGGTLRRFGDTLVGLLQTRVEILALEWSEERGNLTRLLLVVVGILVCLQLAIVVGLVFLVLVIGAEHRVLALGIAALVLLLGSAGGALWLRHWLRTRPPMFRTTIEELRKDRDWIRRKS
jgi:uncharacterized membrane protein YqjE